MLGFITHKTLYMTYWRLKLHKDGWSYVCKHTINSTVLILYTFRPLSMRYVTILLCAWIVTWAASCTSCHIHNLTRLQMCFYNSPCSLTTGITWFNPGCTGGPSGAIGTDDYGGVYSKPQCHRKSCVPGLSLWLMRTMLCIFHNGWFMVALWNRKTIYIFMLWFVLLLFFFLA